MGLSEVVDTLEHVEQLLEDNETGPAQDSLSWQRGELPYPTRSRLTPFAP